MNPPVPRRVEAAIRNSARPVCAYVYDRATLRDTAAAVRAALPAGSLLCYAMKANGHPDVVATLAFACDGLEVASGGELAMARGRTDLIVFGGPGKTDEELSAAVAAGAIVNAESVHELRRLAAVAGDRPVRVTLRVNRATTGVAGSHRMTGVPTQFGIDEADLPRAVAAAAPPLSVVGFGLHAVSNNLDAAAHARFVADAAAWSDGTAKALGVRLEVVNVGGGFGVDYGDAQTTGVDYGDAQTTGVANEGGEGFDLEVLKDGLAALADGPRLLFEPGRFLAAGAGWYAAEVLDVKRTRGRWFAVLRGGTHHFRLPAAWGYSHPFTVLPVGHWPYDFERPAVRDDVVDVVGELCTPRDVLARGAPVTVLRAGDIVVFGNAGAYAWDISHHDFLRHPYPRMLVV